MVLRVVARGWMLECTGRPIAGAIGDQQAATLGQACFEAGQAKNTCVFSSIRRFHRVRNARICIGGQYQSCMVSRLSKQLYRQLRSDPAAGMYACSLARGATLLRRVRRYC